MLTESPKSPPTAVHLDTQATFLAPLALLIRDGAMWLVERVANAARAYGDWRRHQETIRELSALDEHMLADIGVSRNAIVEIARGQVLPIAHAPSNPRKDAKVNSVRIIGEQTKRDLAA